MRKYLLILFLYPALVNSQTKTDTTVVLSRDTSENIVWIKFPVTYQVSTYTDGDSLTGISNTTKKRVIVSPLSLPVSTATTTALNGKQATITTGTTAQYFRGDLSLATFPTTTAAFTNSTNKNFVTDAQGTVIGNTSGTNTGDNATNTQYSGLAASKLNVSDTGAMQANDRAAILARATIATTDSMRTNIYAGINGSTAAIALKAPLASPTFTGTVTLPASTSLTTPVIGVATGTSLAVTGNITTSGGSIGYATGTGGTVTQATNRTTGVTINKISGAITTNNASLAAGAEAAFTVTNSTVAIGDVVLVTARSGQTANTSIPFVTTVANGSFVVTLSNFNASTADTGAMIINFVVIKAVSN